MRSFRCVGENSTNPAFLALGSTIGVLVSSTIENWRIVAGEKDCGISKDVSLEKKHYIYVY
jgi:hypothetical protein